MICKMLYIWCMASLAHWLRRPHRIWAPSLITWRDCQGGVILRPWKAALKLELGRNVETDFRAREEDFASSCCGLRMVCVCWVVSCLSWWCSGRLCDYPVDRYCKGVVKSTGGEGRLERYELGRLCKSGTAIEDWPPGSLVAMVTVGLGRYPDNRCVQEFQVGLLAGRGRSTILSLCHRNKS